MLHFGGCLVRVYHYKTNRTSHSFAIFLIPIYFCIDIAHHAAYALPLNISKRFWVYRMRCNSVSIPASGLATIEKVFFIPCHWLLFLRDFQNISIVQNWPTNSSSVLHVNKLSREPCNHHISVVLFWWHSSTNILSCEHLRDFQNPRAVLWQIDCSL